MSKGTFGDHLRREREMRGVSLEEISAATRIGTRFLEALESEEWQNLPGGIFNRGFVRAVARFLGLDEESLLAEYAFSTSELPESPSWAGAKPMATPTPNWTTWVVAGVLVILLLSSGWMAWRHHVAKRSVRAVAASPAAEAASSQNPPASTPITPDTRESAPLTLRVSAGRAASVTVVADGKSIFDGKMNAGQNERFEAHEQFDVSTDDGTALMLELNTQMLPPMGQQGRAAKVTLTRKDLK